MSTKTFPWRSPPVWVIVDDGVTGGVVVVISPDGRVIATPWVMGVPKLGEPSVFHVNFCA